MPVKEEEELENEFPEKKRQELRTPTFVRFISHSRCLPVTDVKIMFYRSHSHLQGK